MGTTVIHLDLGADRPSPRAAQGERPGTSRALGILASARGMPEPAMGQRTYQGFPLLSAREWNDLAEASDPDRVFSFRGYVGEPAVEAPVFLDCIRMRNLRDGIRVGLNGSRAGGFLYSQHKGPETVGRYYVYVEVPVELQKKESIVVWNEECRSALQYKAQMMTRWELHEAEANARIEEERCDGEKLFTVGLQHIRPQDPAGREKRVQLALLIADYIERRVPLVGLPAFIADAERQISIQ